MKKLKIKFLKYTKIIISFFALIISPSLLNASEIEIDIKGNSFTDKSVILSLFEEKPTSLSDEYSNYLIKKLDNSNLFANVTVKIEGNKYIIDISEYANINKIYFENNERLKDDELESIANEINLNNTNPNSLNNYISEITKIYESFGYNNFNISYTENLYEVSNTADIYFKFSEGKITKINKIIISGNDNVETSKILDSIKSKTKNLTNIFANNNFKNFIVANDTRIISNLYINRGYRNVLVDSKIEYLKSNKVNIYFDISEGKVHQFSNIDYKDKNNILKNNIKIQIDDEINNSLKSNKVYSPEKIKILKENISDIIIKNGLEFFEIASLERVIDHKIDILYEIISVEPKYAKNINIYGNTRTFDYVIRRELDLVEGDAVYQSQIDKIEKKLNSLGLFKSLNVIEKEIDDNLIDLEINIEEKQTGTVNAGLSFGTLDGLAVIAGLSERNFYGTGRSLKALVNTSEDKTQFTFETTDRILYEDDVDISFKANYKEEDFSKASSYKLNTFSTGIGVGYNVNPKLRNNISLDYQIKDYSVTNSSNVASTIASSSGENISFLLSNNLYYSTLNSVLIPNNGTSIQLLNFIETPTSSSNGYVKNTLTYKNYKKIERNIFSYQTRIGNIFSLNNNDILTDDKFSLGGRWLRGFDSFGAGPRNSRTSYVGGNNLFVTKLDYSRQIFNDNDFPIYLNIFNDYGLLWENKTKPTNNDNNVRSSAGFGIKYYSPIGPIGFSWGFPIIEEEYDIKRMFLFSIGNID